MPKPVAIVTLVRRINKRLHNKAEHYRWNHSEQIKFRSNKTTYLEIHATNPYGTLKKRGDYYYVKVTEKKVDGITAKTKKYEKGNVDIRKLAKELGVLRSSETISEKPVEWRKHPR